MSFGYHLQTVVLSNNGPPTIGFVIIVPTPRDLDISVTSFYPLTSATQAWEDVRRVLGERGFELSPARSVEPYRHLIRHDQPKYE
jgi:hypothetical protein